MITVLVSRRLVFHLGSKHIIPAFRKNFGCLDGCAMPYSVGPASPPQIRHSRRFFSVSPKSEKDYSKPSTDVEIAVGGVGNAEVAVIGAEGAVREAEKTVKTAENRLEKWIEFNSEYTGDELKYKVLKEEVESARAALNSARAYHLTLTGSRSNILLPRPESVFRIDQWQQFAAKEELKLPDTQFFESLLSDRYVEAKSIEELPITTPRIGCITSYTDPTTKVQ
ncbi:hypothetical protein HK100_010471, partial [Physocladia obscura]